jgi:hypothetical protein
VHSDVRTASYVFDLGQVLFGHLLQMSAHIDSTPVRWRWGAILCKIRKLTTDKGIDH